MSEDKPEYVITEAADKLAELGYVSEAVQMLGVGYKEPSIQIEAERSVIQRRNGKLESYDLPAFVKISTSFKSELPEISGDALKVWLFIALSINRHSGKANPGLRTIADNVKLAVNTVQKCLQELEGLNLLTVDRQSRKYNIYETPEYVSANRAEPTVSNRDTDTKTVSNFDTTVSNSGETVSPSVILNQSNQSNQKNHLLGIEAAMFQDRPVTEEDIDGSVFEKEALTTFEKDMQLPGNWVWYPGKTSEEKEWKALREFVVKVYRNDRKAFEKYHTWRNQPYVKGSMSNRAIKKDPADFEISWSDYLAHSEMYGKKTDEPRPVYKPTEEPEYVPAPPRK